MTQRAKGIEMTLRSEGSTKHEEIIRIAQDDVLLQVRFLTSFEMTQRDKDEMTKRKLPK